MEQGADNYCRFLKGDWDGFAEIVREYYDGLVFYLNSYLHNLSDAEDMAEETFLVLTTKKAKYKGSSSFKTWLYAIGRNVARKYLRKNGRNVAMSQEDLDKMICGEQDVASGLFAEEEKRHLHRCLRRLLPDYQSVLWLKYFENMKMQDVAVVMNKSLHSVNHLVQRAREALREEMKKEGYYEEL